MIKEQEITYATMGFLSFEDTKQNLRESGINEHIIQYIERNLQIHCIHAHRLGRIEARKHNWHDYEQLLKSS